MPKTKVQYRNVSISPKGEIMRGQHNKFGEWMSFTADISMEKISHAVDNANAVIQNQIWSIQDGFGIPGAQAGDWSGIRDSSPEAIRDMLMLAENWNGNNPWPWEVK